MPMLSMSMGQTPAVWALSTKNFRPCSRQNAPTASMGRMVPQTLLAWVMTTALVFSRSSPSAASRISVPSGLQGIREKATPAASS